MDYIRPCPKKSKQSKIQNKSDYYLFLSNAYYTKLCHECWCGLWLGHRHPAFCSSDKLSRAAQLPRVCVLSTQQERRGHAVHVVMCTLEDFFQSFTLARLLLLGAPTLAPSRRSEKSRTPLQRELKSFITGANPFQRADLRDHVLRYWRLRFQYVVWPCMHIQATAAGWAVACLLSLGVDNDAPLRAGGVGGSVRKASWG